MKYEVVNITQQYREGNIDAVEAMNTIKAIIFPEIQQEDKYIKRIIAFMFDVTEEDITGTSRKEIHVKPKAMYTYFLSKKYEPGFLSKKLSIGYNAVTNRLNVHKGYVISDKEYKKIFNIISKVI
jgi:hypothetical protein